MIIRLYDSMGRLIRKLDLGLKPTGRYLDKNKAAYWDGKNDWGEQAASGVYFYQLRAREQTETKKMVLLK